MKELQYILAQRIGVFYKDEKWKRKIFDEIADYYRSLDMIDFLSYAMWDARIVLKDGTTICFVSAESRCKGQRFSKVIIQSGVEQSIIDAVIKPCISPFASIQCYVVDINHNEIDYI